ncbi:MAG: hypothetical protein U1E26_00400 [Coriobacteriia bacterium]|nr:hypothetical protein [Coriobacteriia bacterium]
MNREVHYDFTRTWALEAGFSEVDAEAIASANWACDRIHTGLAGKRYHWAALGAQRLSRRRFGEAVERGDLVALGEALHTMQDAVGHGFWGHFYHWKGIDRWQHRGPRVRRRLETRSRAMLEAFRLERPCPDAVASDASSLGSHAGTPMGDTCRMS